MKNEIILFTDGNNGIEVQTSLKQKESTKADGAGCYILISYYH